MIQIYRYIIILFIILAFSEAVQPKIILDVGLGFYDPEMKGFDENDDVPFPNKSIFNRNLLPNFSVFYEFFHNARVGYSSYLSYEYGKANLQESQPVFKRSIRYRMLPIETYFRWRPRIELNFTLAPIWGRGRITMDTKPNDKYEDWNELLNSFGDDDPLAQLGGTDVMINDWFGYSGLIGARYYLSPRTAIDLKIGFMHNGYKKDNWVLQKNQVIGPDLSIKDLPLFTLKYNYAIK